MKSPMEKKGNKLRNLKRKAERSKKQVEKAAQNKPQPQAPLSQHERIGQVLIKFGGNVEAKAHDHDQFKKGVEFLIKSIDSLSSQLVELKKETERLSEALESYSDEFEDDEFEDDALEETEVDKV